MTEALIEMVTRLDPSEILAAAGIDADPWQKKVLRSDAPRGLWLAARQTGKSLTAAAKALATALYRPGSLVLLLSPSQRQSVELLRDKVVRLWQALGEPQRLCDPTVMSIHFANGSRIISLPGTEGTIRGYSNVALLVIDEAARVADTLYRSVRPMLAVSGGRLVALSTPFGKRGWFWEEWTGTGSWEHITVRADQCPRIAPEFLAAERQALGARWYAQEYLCSFEAAADACFAEADLARLLDDSVRPIQLGV
jgi:hypothetical protein